MKKIIGVLALSFFTLPSFAQFGGVVYDPTNFHQAVRSYIQLQQQLSQLQQTYALYRQQYQLLQLQAQQIQSLPSRYRYTFTNWRAFAADATYGNTTSWVNGANAGDPSTIAAGYRALVPVVRPANVTSPNANDQAEWQQQYGLLELQDAATMNSVKTVADVRTNVQQSAAALAQLEGDSTSADPNLHTQTALLQKVTIANMLMMRQLQDTNRLLVALVDLQVQQASQQRWERGHLLNAAAARR